MVTTLLVVAGLVLAGFVVSLAKNNIALKSDVAALKEASVRRFGLEEARAASLYLANAGADAMAALKGVVFGVLGYENAVSADVTKVVGGLTASVAKYQGDIEQAREAIEAAENKIRSRERSIRNANKDAADLNALAALFDSNPAS